MALPEYWLDTSALIESKKRWYRFDVVPGFWTFIDVMVQQGTVCCPVSVYDELVGRTDDELAAWAGEREGLRSSSNPTRLFRNLLATWRLM